MPKLKKLVRISIIVYLAVAVVIIGCLVEISYTMVVTSNIRLLEVKQVGSHGVLATVRSSLPSGQRSPLGAQVTQIEDLTTGVSCSLAGKIVKVTDGPTDSLHFTFIYIEGLQQQDILRNMVGSGRSQNIEIIAGKEPFFKKLFGQLLWKQKFR